MARVTAEKVQETKTGLLQAAKRVLMSEGYAGLSTRAVAKEAGAPMSQIQYHFGSKEGMVLALFEHLNAELLDRQKATYADTSLSLADKWRLACDYLDEDLASGYVRVLHELWAAGLANSAIGEAMTPEILGWYKPLNALSEEIREKCGLPEGLDSESTATLIGVAFIGAESHLLLGLEEKGLPLRNALRRIADVIEVLEKRKLEGTE